MSSALADEDERVRHTRQGHPGGSHDSIPAAAARVCVHIDGVLVIRKQVLQVPDQPTTTTASGLA